ncbi:putative amine oxidase [Powai lake megavirus]|uniref:Putative amine oxidase n=1 Tax=Powai lake megavirus TaxID=1842663 RepID=A0A167RPZ5_9VIRU|nr:putative amine oxidase [Powai lake megavirus]ANB50986.1 putative amine oxidase [Powai lake megavirus]
MDNIHYILILNLSINWLNNINTLFNQFFINIKHIIIMSSLNIIYIVILIIIITIIYVLFNSYYNCKNATTENLQLIDSSPILDCDILIVGAGASGIYCAWRLSQEYPNKRIIVAESTDRIGGRLESIPFGNADIYAEMGV